MGRRVEVEIREHPDARRYESLSEHKVAVVTTPKGYVFACTYAPADEPLTEEVVRRDWRESRRSFRPYDTSRGVYLS
jgi:hypothetical protein